MGESVDQQLGEQTMKNKDLLKLMDNELLEKLFGFCYGRTKDSYEAQELCSDIVFALVKAANREGDIENPYPFIWRVARNVYADFSDKRRLKSDMQYEGNPEDILLFIADERASESDNGDDELLNSVYRRIAFLTKAYREVMIMFYLDGLSTAEIAAVQNTSEVNVRQRLFSARKKVRNEVESMSVSNNKPVALDKVKYKLVGTGNPLTGDPRDVLGRTFSDHIILLCRKKPMSASEIAEELNVPTMYVEEELDILAKGANGEYGILRRLDSGKYAVNIVLLDKETIEKAQAVYTERIPAVCGIIADFIEKRKEDYLSFPYLNRQKDLNLILWQQIFCMATAFERNTEKILREKYFSDVKDNYRPFAVFGHIDNGKSYGCGWDGIGAKNICGYAAVKFDNIYISRIKKHFSCGHDIANDMQLQLALRAINGLDINSLSEEEKEHAAKAVECGYLYREGEALYTKIPVSRLEDHINMFKITDELDSGYFETEAQEAAERLADLIRKAVPDYLLGEWRFVNSLAGLPLINTVVEELIGKGILTPPEDGIGAEGCWAQLTMTMDN